MSYKVYVNEHPAGDNVKVGSVAVLDVSLSKSMVIEFAENGATVIVGTNVLQVSKKVIVNVVGKE